MKKVISLALGVALAIVGLAAPVAATGGGNQSIDRNVTTTCGGTIDATAAGSVDIYIFDGTEWDGQGQKVYNNTTGIIQVVPGFYIVEYQDADSNDDEQDFVSVLPCGIQGDPGNDGDDGDDGDDGANGTNGTNGVDGKDGQTVFVEVPVTQVVERVVTPNIYKPFASATTCGDPRVTITLDNSISNVPVTFKLTFYSGKDGSRIVKFKTVAAGAIKVTNPLWLKGGGTLLRVRGQNLEPLLVFPVFRGEQACN